MSEVLCQSGTSRKGQDWRIGLFTSGTGPDLNVGRVMIVQPKAAVAYGRFFISSRHDWQIFLSL